MILKRLHLRLGKKAMEKLMKPVEATLEGRHTAPERLSNFSCLRLGAKPLDPLDPLCTLPGTPGIYS